MQNSNEKILIWLPSPMGDAVLCTPALRAIRKRFNSAHIFFLANNVVREVLADTTFNDSWLEISDENPLTVAKTLKKHNFSYAILFKNSFKSALAVYLARIPSRIGYAREGRGSLLTEKLYPPKLSLTKFKPISMIDYYLAIASWLGADISDRNLELAINPQDTISLRDKLPQLIKPSGPIVIFVPGGAFGPSKRWPADRYSKTADYLISNYKALVVVSVSLQPAEKQIAEKICRLSQHNIINLADKNINLGELKALFSVADLVITNDTGPRHIAIAFERKVITLFGPNNPVWTETNCDSEIKLIGDAPCAPCAKPVCKKEEHLCMQDIMTEAVCEAAKKLFKNSVRFQESDTEQNFIQLFESFFINSAFKKAFEQQNLTSIEDIFYFNAGTKLQKENLAEFRSRIKFDLYYPPVTLFLKRYQNPPILFQLKNWFCAHRKISTAYMDVFSSQELTAAGLKIPKVIAYGQQWGTIFEKRSFTITQKIPDAEALERKLPRFFHDPPTIENLRLKREFIYNLAVFIGKFHNTGYRHRDLYLSHIFYSDTGQFYLIDLARAFKPVLLAKRFRIKDIAQLYYSADKKYFSKTDRLRFYHKLTGRTELTKKDKRFISKVKSKAIRMAKHDIKHQRPVPFVED